VEADGGVAIRTKRLVGRKIAVAHFRMSPEAWKAVLACAFDAFDDAANAERGTQNTEHLPSPTP
jgi:hypothetical protein